MTTKDFYYELPQELIAQTPLEDRTASRLMVVNRTSGEIEHKHFYDIVDRLREGDCLVMNNTRVIPARLYGTKEGSGGKIEFLLLKRLELDKWEVILRPGKKAKPGSRFEFGDGLLRAEVLEIIEDGNRIVRFEYDGVWEELLDKLGEMPLPPYIKEKLTDRERYQTVYSKIEGSAAAPTAGLHFTKELLEKIKRFIDRSKAHGGVSRFQCFINHFRIRMRGGTQKHIINGNTLWGDLQPFFSQKLRSFFHTNTPLL